jgi:hypothetical protein
VNPVNPVKDRQQPNRPKVFPADRFIRRLTTDRPLSLNQTGATVT